MELLNELKRQLANSMEEISALSLEIQSYSQIKESLKSASSEMGRSNDTFDKLADSLSSSSNKLKDAAQSIEAIAETLTKLDTVSLQLKLDKQSKDIELLQKSITANFKMLDNNLSSKIDNSTLVGRFFKK
jgi:chromosome segregation ATPase